MTETDLARKMASILQDSFGGRAAPEAERRAREAQAAGMTREADDWRRVRAIIEANDPAAKG